MPSRDLKKFSEIGKELTASDTQPINCLINASLKNLHGRPAVYPFTDSGLQTLVTNSLAYFQYVEKANAQIENEKHQLILDVDSYALFLGISRKTLASYQQRDSTWNDTIMLFKDAIASSKKQLALSGRIPPIMAIFDLSNNHGYLNASTFVNDNKTVTTQSNSDNRLSDKVKELGLVWNEEKQRFEEC